eukprot:CAMPEP_0195298108 /NCGR_PEP_ID=MMETSP0707-20130614/22808_1 /TAXON_ID=33640 /ORGANISM="Asterionellopsis glacialis, Strain CCMP134" /LENGTH=495 /DNA_ID=CAMNT_0040360105 /DNA_START=140 /DNA_END=1627 /DNA_ORIENTATION=+
METAPLATSPASTAVRLVTHAPPLPQWQSFVFSSVAPTIAAPFTNPFAVAKTQLQVQTHVSGASGAKFRGMLDFFRYAVASDGVSILQRGLAPVMMREASKNLFRLGLYQPFMSRIHDKSSGPAPVWKRIIAGAASGGVGAIVCNPFEIVRIKAQALSLDSSTGKGISSRIFKEEGALGFYRAGGASVALGMVCTSVNLTSYTLLHEAAVERFGLMDGPIVDMACAFVSGFFAAVAMNPIDVTRTRLMTQPSPPIYRSAFHAAWEIYTAEGPKAFFRGFVPSFLRIGPHFVITFMLLEQMRRFAHSRNAARAHEEYLVSIFKKIDIDSNGEIDNHELMIALQEADPRNDSFEAERLSKNIFDVADVDGNGSISLDEFMEAAKSLHLGDLLRGQQLLAVFRTFDDDGNGTINESELYEGLRQQRERPASKVSKAERSQFDKQLRQDVQRIMDKVDADGDRNIDFKEFLVAMDLLNDCEEKHVMNELLQSAGVALGE